MYPDRRCKKAVRFGRDQSFLVTERQLFFAHFFIQRILSSSHTMTAAAPTAIPAAMPMAMPLMKDGRVLLKNILKSTPLRVIII